jgi:uncharacterized membrane protein
MTKTNGAAGWLKSNAWNLITTAAMILVGCITFYTLTNYRLNQAEAAIVKTQELVAKYPSQQYFELRFTNIEKNQDEIKVLLMKHLGEK